jgi:hypothetical protein
MSDSIIFTGDGFWNIRGSFKLGGILDIGTHTSLARMANGHFVVLDSYPLKGEVRDQVMKLTDGGKLVDAVINLHPFHTVFVPDAVETFPDARHIGTSRHHELFPDVSWDTLTSNDPALHAQFAADFEFSVTAGMDFVSADPKLHFASVLAYHKASRTLHVDDTLTWIPIPLVGGLQFHPTLKQVLQPRAGAVRDFRQWAASLIELCGRVNYIATAHAKSEGPQDNIQGRVKEALDKVESTLAAHEKKWG